MPRPEIASLLEQYRSLEWRAGFLMQRACGPLCRVCTTSCCRLGICREALESPFLRAIQGAGEDFDARRGFCGSKGCRLKVGRPPICHAFICHRVLASQPDDVHRYALECLGDLVGFMGRKVWRGRHLVEAMVDRDLRAANMAVFLRRMETAGAALVLLEAFFNQGHKLSVAEMKVLALVRKP